MPATNCTSLSGRYAPSSVRNFATHPCEYCETTRDDPLAQFHNQAIIVMDARFSKCQNFSTSPHAFSTLDAHREGEADSESSEADAEVAAEISPSSAILAGSLQSRALSDKLPPTCAPYRSALPVHRMSSSFSRTALSWEVALPQAGRQRRLDSGLQLQAPRVGQKV